MSKDDDSKWFAKRLYRTKKCPRCDGHGEVDEPYALTHWEQAIKGAPSDSIHACVAGMFDIFTACREAVQIARAAKRPVVFDFNDQIVVVRWSDDPDLIARVWWQRAYGCTPEETWRAR